MLVAAFPLQFARLNADLTEDRNFRGTYGELEGDSGFIIDRLALQPDGKILAAGRGRRHALVRFRQDGLIDSTFVTGQGFDGALTAIVPEGNGRILVAGTFRSYNGVARAGFARLNADGSLDPSFVPPAVPVLGGWPTAVAFDADGGILATGRSLSFPVPGATGLVKLENAVSRLSNGSVRTLAGTGDRTLVVGFAIAGTGSKQVLLRAIGPSLQLFGVSGALADPQLRLFNGVGASIAFNDDWSGDGAVVAATQRVGAFPLAGGSRDAVVLAPLSGPASYSAHVGAASATGIALLESYDADAITSAARLSNLSARSQVGTGANLLVVGFVIEGNAPKTVLLRGIGPGLAPFGVTDALIDPQLRLYNRNANVLHANDDWGGASDLAAAFRQTGAFALAPNSRDAALLVTLAPGLYSAQVSGVRETTGVALVEVYEVP